MSPKDMGTGIKKLGKNGKFLFLFYSGNFPNIETFFYSFGNHFSLQKKNKNFSQPLQSSQVHEKLVRSKSRDYSFDWKSEFFCRQSMLKIFFVILFYFKTKINN
jgi:hypothetical protein